VFHAYGWDLGFLPTLKLGSTMFLEEENLGAADRQAGARARGRRVAGHAVDVRRAVEAADAKKLEVKAPRYLAASSRLDQAVADDFFDKYGVRLLSCYHRPRPPRSRFEDSGKYPTTVGKPIESVEVKITSPDGSPIKPAASRAMA